MAHGGFVARRQFEQQCQMIWLDRAGEAHDGIGTQPRILGVVRRHLGEHTACVVRIASGQGAHHFLCQRSITCGQQVAQQRHRELGVGGRSQAQGIALHTCGRGGVGHAFHQHLGISDTRAGIAAQRVPGGEHGLKHPVIKVWLCQHLLHIRREAGEHSIRNPAHAFKTHLSIRILEQRTHPFLFLDVHAAQGDQRPHAIAGGQGTQAVHGPRAAFPGERRERGIRKVRIAASSQVQQLPLARAGLAFPQCFRQLRGLVQRLGRGFDPRRLRLVDLQLPQPAVTMNRVGTEHPVIEVKRAVRARGHAGGTEEVAAAQQFNAVRGVARPLPDEREVVDAVIAPRGHHHTTAELHHGTGCLARRMDHAKRAAQFAVPGDKGMHRSTAVDPLKPVVRAFDH